MAVIVHERIDSDVAAVGLSINPLTNDFDEAVVDANWGPGVSVASGIASPDHFIPNKSDSTVIERQPGATLASVPRSPRNADRAGERRVLYMDIALSKGIIAEASVAWPVELSKTLFF